MIVTSIIIINYNTAALTIQAIKSIEDQIVNHKDFELILVDNASNIDDFNLLKNSLSNLNKIPLHLIRSRINVGFGAGNMLGIQKATGKFYTFINSDVILEENAIESLVAFLQKTPSAAMVGCQALNENHKKFKGFDYNLSLFTELFSDKFLHFINPKKFPKRIPNGIEPIKIGAVSGSLFCAKAEDFNEVGGFDSNIFLYYEEKDLAFRISKTLKKEMYFLPNVHYIHLCGKSTAVSQKIKNELKISQFYTIKKNLGSFQYIIFYTIQILIFLIKSPFNKKNRNYLSLVLNGVSVANSIKHSQKIT